MGGSGEGVVGLLGEWGLEDKWVDTATPYSTAAASASAVAADAATATAAAVTTATAAIATAATAAPNGVAAGG